MNPWVGEGGGRVYLSGKGRGRWGKKGRWWSGRGGIFSCYFACFFFSFSSSFSYSFLFSFLSFPLPNSLSCSHSLPLSLILSPSSSPSPYLSPTFFPIPLLPLRPPLPPFVGWWKGPFPLVFHPSFSFSTPSSSKYPIPPFLLYSSSSLLLSSLFIFNYFILFYFISFYFILFF